MFDAGGAIEHRVDNRVFHDIDTDEGQSGSPIWSGMGQRVAAVHTGHGGDPHPDLNRGVAMNAEIVGWLTDQFN
jgi:V8-like Glu-specific endopeptidase